MTAIVAMPAEVRELSDACAELDAARLRHESAQVAVREAGRELENAKSRRLRAVDALETACRAARATLPTLTEQA